MTPADLSSPSHQPLANIAALTLAKQLYYLDMEARAMRLEQKTMRTWRYAPKEMKSAYFRQATEQLFN